MDEFEKFRYTLFQLVSEMIRSKFEEANGKAEENLAKELLDIEANHVGTGKASNRDIFLMKVFHEFAEIDSSYMTLKDSEIYIGKFPYRRMRLSKFRYIGYHIANYLNEVYILQQRITSSMKRISRLYKKDQRYDIITQLTIEILKNVEYTFKGIINIRGGHVHVSRYRDKDIIRFGALESLIETGDGNFVKVLTPLYQGTYRKIRSEWENIIKKNNETVATIQSFFDVSCVQVPISQHRDLNLCWRLSRCLDRANI